jgi:hypothetical protein
VRTDTEIKQTVIAILTSARDGEVNSAGVLAINESQPAAGQAGQQALTAAAYAMTLFHALAAEYEAACPDADVQDFLRRRALEAVAGDEEAA